MKTLKNTLLRLSLLTVVVLTGISFKTTHCITDNRGYEKPLFGDESNEVSAMPVFEANANEVSIMPVDMEEPYFIEEDADVTIMPLRSGSREYKNSAYNN